jgi:hypothetical protein
MYDRELHHMYQAWQQGQDDYVRDWLRFVEWAAQWNKTTNQNIIDQLQKQNWFKRPQE